MLKILQIIKYRVRSSGPELNAESLFSKMSENLKVGEGLKGLTFLMSGVCSVYYSPECRLA